MNTNDVLGIPDFQGTGPLHQYVTRERAEEFLRLITEREEFKDDDLHICVNPDGFYYIGDWRDRT